MERKTARRANKVKMWPTTTEQHAYMKMRKGQNLANSISNENENGVFAALKTTGLKWTRQAQWGYRLFDFWCSAKGIAVEVDGPEHDKAYDAFRDRKNLKTSGIVVIHIGNNNERDLERALLAIAESCSWNERREALGLKPITYCGVKVA